MHSRHASNLYDPKIKKNFQNHVDAFWVNPIKHGRSQTYFKKYIYKGLLFTTWNEYIWAQKCLIFVHGLKSAILARYFFLDKNRKFRPQWQPHRKSEQRAELQVFLTLASFVKFDVSDRFDSNLKNCVTFISWVVT